MTTPPFRIRCISVPYRRGFIEVIGGIQASLVNIETWEVSVDHAGPLADLGEVPGEMIVANTEIELTPAEARALAAALVAAADTVSSRTSTP